MHCLILYYCFFAERCVPVKRDYMLGVKRLGNNDREIDVDFLLYGMYLNRKIHTFCSIPDFEQLHLKLTPKEVKELMANTVHLFCGLN